MDFWPVFAEPIAPYGLRIHINDLRLVPVDTLVGIVEKEIREAYRQGKDAKSRQRRRRPDSVDFNLRVFDLREQGKPFEHIAHELHRAKSSVRTAYQTALRRIGLLEETPSSCSTDHFDWDTFDPEHHYKTCRECQMAKRPEEMCALLRGRVTSVQRGQREQPWTPGKIDRVGAKDAAGY